MLAIITALTSDAMHDMRGVATHPDRGRMTTVDYRLFINRDLPLRERGCESKAVYLSRGEARSRARNGRAGYAGLHPYRCRYCPHWHLGHRRRRH